MDHPFIDATKLTDEELLKRIARCHDMAYNAMMAGHATMYDSIVSQLETYQAAYEERMAKRRHEEYLEKNPDGVIDIGEVRDISPLRKEDPS